MPLKPLIKLASLCNPCLINLWPEAVLYSFLFNFHLPFCVLHIHFFSLHVIVRGGGIKLPENWIFRETDCGEENRLTSLSLMCHFPSLFTVFFSSLEAGHSWVPHIHVFLHPYFQTLMEHVTRGRRKACL